jgi:hypothetical protein
VVFLYYHIEANMVNVLDSRFYPGYIPRQRKDEPEDDGFSLRLSTMRKERNLTQQTLRLWSAWESRR